MGLLVRVAQQSRCLTFCSTRFLSSFRADDLQITLTNVGAPKPHIEQLKFGANHTDHMLEIDWTEEHGWGAPVIRPLEHLRIHPAAKVLHYASELFEGMKAYRCVDNKIRLFRPMQNMARMSSSAKRAGLPDFDQVELVKCIKKLISIDQEWVPYSDMCSLYVRPTMIGTEPQLGVTYSTQAKLFVIIGPTGPYFPTKDMKPTKPSEHAIGLLVDPQYVRAWPGGCGTYKMGSNYAPTVAIQKEAVKLGYQQVLWLFGEDHEMTEAGQMNLFVYWINEQGEKELITPPLDSGLILPGVTRKSLLELAREWNEFKVSERKITMGDFVKAHKDGRVKEVFAAGTASVVCPVKRMLYKGEELKIDVIDDPSAITQRFYKDLVDIHYYRRPHHWMDSIDDDVSEDMRTVAQ